MSRSDRGDRGASLVMAMIFLVVGGLISVALTEQSTGNIQNTSNYQTLRAVNYAADAAMDGAIQQVRYHGTCESFPKGSASLQISNEYVYVTCSSTAIPLIVANLNTSGTLSSPNPAFGQLDAITAQPVYLGSTGENIGSITSVSADGSTATMTFTAGPVSGTVYVGQISQSYDSFLACASSSPISACTTTDTPEIDATVLFDNATSSGGSGPEQGASARVFSWVVHDANA